MKASELYEDYLPQDDLFSTEDTKINRLKHIIFDKLNESDRRIIILYAELHSIRKVAAKLNVSPASAWIWINRIREDIKTEYNNKKI